MQITTAIIVLAAGSSSRMGRSKQLLEYQGVPLLAHAVNIALGCSPKDTLVVLGANDKEHQKLISGLPVRLVHHHDWHRGIGSSIKAGVGEMLKTHPGIHQIIIMVCDQPFLSSDVLNSLIARQLQTGKNIIACRYAGTIGVPVLFTRAFFPHLMKLRDDEGAKKIVSQNSDEVMLVDFEYGKHDIDTPDDIFLLKKPKSH